MARGQGAPHTIPEQGSMDQKRVTMMINKVKGIMVWNLKSQYQIITNNKTKVKNAITEITKKGKYDKST